MRNLLAKHFGKITAFLYVILYITTNHSKWSITYFNEYVDTFVTYGLIFSVILLVGIYCFYHKKWILLCRIVFCFLVLGIQSAVFIGFEKSLKQDFEQEKISMIEMNNAMTLGNMILIFVLFIAFLLLGSAFDYLINKKR